MTMKSNRSKVRIHRRRDRGSALLVSLMIMVGLSMLGLGFVAVSETESAIAANERNAIEAQSAAEAGAKLVIEWFQDPVWAQNQGIMPANDVSLYPNMKTERVLTGTYTGVYKPLSTQRLCDKPYKPEAADRFYGTEDSADLIVSTSTAPGVIDIVNERLFGSANANPRITELRVYAPPIYGATLVTVAGPPQKQFWKGGVRSGVATIAATASKFNPAKPTVAVATRKVRIIVGEFPIPVPAGPLQSASGGIGFTGTSDIHWGMELSDSNLTDTKQPTSIPWANAYERVHFERGYDKEVWDIKPTTEYDESDYLAEMVERSFTDPWFGTRAYANNNVDHVQYEAWLDESDTALNRQFSAFENQNVYNYPNFKKVVFPKVDYAFWKRIALQGRGQPGVFYFRYSGPSSPASQGGLFLKSGIGTANTIAHWANTIGTGAKLGAGLYFFDTLNGSNPQGSATPQLTPAVEWGSSDLGSQFLMQGFVYLNSTLFRTTGSGSIANRKFLYPGEIFRDIGHRKWNTGTNQWAVDANGAIVHSGASDGKFSFDDLNDNKRFDVVVYQKTVAFDDDGTSGTPSGTRTVYVPKPWHSNEPGVLDPETGVATPCVMPPVDWNGSQTGSNYCSEPHEPYLNFKYTSTRTNAIVVGWYPNNAQVQMDKKSTSGCPNSATTTTATKIPLDCSSNAYDLDGPLVDIPAIMDGLFYNEGDFDSQGNFDLYGAMLIGGDVFGTGAFDLWFKEELSRGEYIPPGAPRVIMYSMQTDEVE